MLTFAPLLFYVFYHITNIQTLLYNINPDNEKII